MMTRKICLVGDFGVGKTSLVGRFVNQTFTEKYLTTVGVKVDTKPVVTADGQSIKLVIWDIAGTDTASVTYKNYVRGAAAYLLVADGTRAYTLDNALNLKKEIEDALGPLPFVGLVNKMDLESQWEIDPARMDELAQAGQTWFPTSAKSGLYVEEAFQQLASSLLSGTATNGG